MSRSVFITGTDTECGKTHVSCALLRGYAQAGVAAVGMKPVASGAVTSGEGLRNDDALALQAASSVAADYGTINPYCFEPAIAPELAAGDAGVAVDRGVISAAHAQLAIGAERVLVEGAGGWHVGVGAADGAQWRDWVQAFNWPVVLVVGMRLGCLNHAQLSAEVIARDAQLLGWVANVLPPEMPRLDDNLQLLHQRLQAPCLGVLPAGGQVLPTALLEAALGDSGGR